MGPFPVLLFSEYSGGMWGFYLCRFSLVAGDLVLSILLTVLSLFLEVVSARRSLLREGLCVLQKLLRSRGVHPV